MNHDNIQLSLSELEAFIVYFSETKTTNYALLVLEDSIGYQTGYFGLCAGNPTSIIRQIQETTTAELQSTKTQRTRQKV